MRERFLIAAYNFKSNMVNAIPTNTLRPQQVGYHFILTIQYIITNIYSFMHFLVFAFVSNSYADSPFSRRFGKNLDQQIFTTNWWRISVISFPDFISHEMFAWHILKCTLFIWSYCTPDASWPLKNIWFLGQNKSCGSKSNFVPWYLWHVSSFKISLESYTFGPIINVNFVVTFSRR